MLEEKIGSFQAEMRQDLAQVVAFAIGWFGYAAPSSETDPQQPGTNPRGRRGGPGGGGVLRFHDQHVVAGVVGCFRPHLYGRTVPGDRQAQVHHRGRASPFTSNTIPYWSSSFTDPTNGVMFLSLAFRKLPRRDLNPRPGD
jgi:hypothetical protein